MKSIYSRLKLFSTGIFMLLLFIMANYLVDKKISSIQQIEEDKIAYQKFLRRDVVQQFAITTSHLTEENDLVITGWLRKRSCPLSTSDPEDSVEFILDYKEKKPSLRIDYDFTEGSSGKSLPPGIIDYGLWTIYLKEEDLENAEVVGFSIHNCSGIIVGPREFVRFTIDQALLGDFLWTSPTYVIDADPS